jgi:hypothetical protein
LFTPELLEAHNQRIKAVEYRPETCHHCHGSKRSLRTRQIVRRLIRFITGGLVYRDDVFVILWTCTACHRSFRHLPPFLKPHKRFVTPNIVEKSSEVLKRKRKPYRQAALNEPPNKTAILYDGKEMMGSKLSHVTVWRWVQWMGEFMSGLLSTQPKMATKAPEDGFEFSELQAKEPKCRENLVLARRLWLAQVLTS